MAKNSGEMTDVDDDDDVVIVIPTIYDSFCYVEHIKEMFGIANFLFGKLHVSLLTDSLVSTSFRIYLSRRLWLVRIGGLLWERMTERL